MRPDPRNSDTMPRLMAACVPEDFVPILSAISSSSALALDVVTSTVIKTTDGYSCAYCCSAMVLPMPAGP